MRPGSPRRRPGRLRPTPTCLALALLAIPWVSAAPAVALERLTFLLPAPPQLPAFAPWVIAKQLGYYAAAGYDVEFATGRGGADVAKQVGAGNAPIGTALGDTPILVRANGVPVKTVALMGGGALAVVVARNDRGIHRLADLRGKKVSVMSFQEANYFALLGALAAAKVPKRDVDVEAVGPGGVVSLVVAGGVDACVCTPDWEIDVKQALPDAVSLPTSTDVPGMAQAIVASDETVAKRPDMVRAIVQASLKGMAVIVKDPAAAADAFAAAEPGFAGKTALLTEIFKNYRRRAYDGQAVPGAMDPDRLARLQAFYLSVGQIKAETPLDKLYTNQFVQ